MRQLASFLLLGLAFTAGAAEVWRWKDAEGVTHLSDRPVPGAERITVNSPRPAAPVAPAAPPPSAPAAPRPESVPYLRCEIAAPVSDAVFQHVDPVPASVALEPALQGGHRIQVFLNGSRVTDWPGEATGHTFPSLFRGSYTLAVRVFDADGRLLCAGPSITFHVRQPSLLSPARRPAG